MRLLPFPAWILALVFTALVLAGPASPASADGSPVLLDLKPAAGYDGAYFSLQMAPGETREFAVELGNHGSAPVAARAYAADVYSLINGGFGARLDGEPTSGTTRWVAFEPATVDLEAGQALIRTFTVSVPADATPGDHITSLVLQNAEPIGVGDGGVMINQVQRRAIAITITVPGPRMPSLTIGALHHKVSAETSFVSFDITNSGNTHLRPGGTFSLADAEGREITRFPVALDTVYAGTTTSVEVPFDSVLREGNYSADLTLRFDGGTAASGATLLVVKEADAAPAPPAAGTSDGRVHLDQPASIGHWLGDGSARPIAGAVALLGLIALPLLLIQRLRKTRRPQDTVTSPVRAHTRIAVGPASPTASVDAETESPGRPPSLAAARFRDQRNSSR